ncbi:unnamed protein product [Protopolystoma xenopodis]|uniref:Uncharacterized protein n=1 Tax=Protopolystoma xenopodis TaxID=117903 RepID=A0A448XSZ8_9PLAT|nr:unnamed protein product [Protopolystoma xenopodis]
MELRTVFISSKELAFEFKKEVNVFGYLIKTTADALTTSYYVYRSLSISRLILVDLEPCKVYSLEVYAVGLSGLSPDSADLLESTGWSI